MKKSLLFLLVVQFFVVSTPSIYAGNGAGWFVGGLAAGALTTAAINNRPRREYVEVRTNNTVDTYETDRLNRRLQAQEEEIYRMKEEKRREQQQKELARNKKKKEEKKAERKQKLDAMQLEYNKELERLNKEILQKEELIEKLQQDDTTTKSTSEKKDTKELKEKSKEKETLNTESTKKAEKS